jgi:signal transduction histidine kinase
MPLIKKLSALRGWSPLRMASVLGIIFMVLILARGAIQLKVTYDQNAERWLDHVAGDLVKLSAYIDQNFDTSFLLLDSVTQMVLLKGIGDAEGLRREMSGSALHQILKDRMSALPHVDVVTVIADDGAIINSTRSYPPPKINLADRDYFVDALGGNGAGGNGAAGNGKGGNGAGVSQRTISAPIANRVNGTWTFYISHRLTGDRGQFIGMVVIGLRIGFFADFFERMQLPAGSTISLYRDDFLLLSRWPRNDSLLGKSLSGGAMPEILNNNPSGAGVIFYNGPRFSDQNQKDSRIVGARKLERYPALLTLTVPESVFLAQWRELKWTIIAVTLIGLAIAAVFGWFFIRLLRRREQDMKEMDLLRLRAENASQAKSQFLAMISHELRTPLSGLLGFSELLKDTPLNAEQKDYAEMAHASGILLLDIINDVLDISKIEAGELTIHISKFSPRELAADVVALYSQNARIKNISLDFEVADDVPAACFGDPQRLRQVLSNLVNNAIKFTESGKVQVVISALPAESAKVTLRLEVFDTGIGIDDAALEKLFQRFVQLDASLSRRYGGTGLGLYISKQLVELMGGRIGARSRRGVGSQFWFEVDVDVKAEVEAEVEVEVKVDLAVSAAAVTAN